MGIKKGQSHHEKDVQGTPDEWVQRQLEDIRKAQRRANRFMGDTFAQIAQQLREKGSIAGRFAGDDE